MPVLGLRTGQSPKKSYWMCIPSLTATAFSPTSRWGGWVAVGGGGKAAKQGENPTWQKCGRLFADCRPHRPLSIFYLKQKL
jgi:hypothetical protein